RLPLAGRRGPRPDRAPGRPAGVEAAAGELTMRALAPLAALVVLTGCGGGGTPVASAPTPKSDMVVVKAKPKPKHQGPKGRYKTAHVRRATPLRAAPGGHVIAHIARRTEFGSERVLAVTGRRSGWLRVTATEAGNGHNGWIRASAARLG